MHALGREIQWIAIAILGWSTSGIVRALSILERFRACLNMSMAITTPRQKDVSRLEAPHGRSCERNVDTRAQATQLYARAPRHAGLLRSAAASDAPEAASTRLRVRHGAAIANAW